MKIADIPDIEGLSIPEKILLVEDIWDSIAFETTHVPFPESHKEELDKRFSKYQTEPENVLTMKQLQKNIEKRK